MPDFCLASGRQGIPVPVKSGSVQKQLPVSNDCYSVPAFQSSGRLQHAHTTDFRLRTSGSAPASERLLVTGICFCVTGCPTSGWLRLPALDTSCPVFLFLPCTVTGRLPVTVIQPGSPAR
ncbi:hypothetical protein NN561_020263 [Cricetulus griseus]